MKPEANGEKSSRQPGQQLLIKPCEGNDKSTLTLER
jgi:hypothetical protein